MAKNRLQEIHDAGQSIWLDSIDRRMLHDGELDRRVSDDALTGMTSNPTIFQKALASSNAYDDQIHELAVDRGRGRSGPERRVDHDVDLEAAVGTRDKGGRLGLRPRR